MPPCCRIAVWCYVGTVALGTDWVILGHRCASTVAHRAVAVLRNSFEIVIQSWLELDVRYLVSEPLFGRLLLVGIIAALPEIFLLTVGQISNSRATRHRDFLINASRILVIICFVYLDFSLEESLASTLVMVSFDVFQRAQNRLAKGGGELNQQLEKAPSVVETVLTRAQPSDATTSVPSFVDGAANGSPSANANSGALACTSNTAELREPEIVRLQNALNVLTSASKAKEALLRSTQEELKKARATLNETFTDYSALRDEMKTVKQNMARDHQAIVYRKDIELFALRKGNEQKERYIKEHDAKLEEVYQQQKATMELKDAQLKMLKERLQFLDRRNSPKMDSEEHADGDQALEVRLLRVKNGRSASIEDDKDVVIAKLEEQLEVAKKAADEVVNQQAELQRAWDIAKKIQASLREERELHMQSKEQLQEMAVRLEEEIQRRSGANSINRLPTIEEDRNELEAMFDTAQEDNLRLYAEVEALEKRLRDANIRIFAAAQEAESLREQVHLERAISDDLETARPSVVHRAHFQRMESQLKESRELLDAKTEEIESLKRTISGKDHYIKDLQSEIDAAINFHTQDQDEIEALKQKISELQATKEQLMHDHERLAIQRTRQRVSPIDYTSARSSGATLITELSPQLTTRPVEASTPVENVSRMPDSEPERNNSIQSTPKRHIRSESAPNRVNLISTDIPPAELRHSRRKSLGLRGFVRKIVRKDESFSIAKDEGKENAPPVHVNKREPTEKAESKNEKRPVLGAKDHNTILRRPQTASPALSLSLSSKIATNETTPPVRPGIQRTSTPRYYAVETSPKPLEERPVTAAPTAQSKTDDAVASRVGSRRSWGAT